MTITKNLKNKCCRLSMLHKTVERGKTDAKCNILLKLSCYGCYQDKLYTRHALYIKRSITIGDITIGFGMYDAICGLEITMIKINFSFCSNDKDKSLF